MSNATDKIIAKGKKIAAHMLEAVEAEILFSNGVFSVSGTNRSKTFGEIAFSAYVPHNTNGPLKGLFLIDRVAPKSPPPCGEG